MLLSRSDDFTMQANTGFRFLPNQQLHAFYVRGERVHITMDDEETGAHVSMALDPQAQEHLLSILLKAKKLRDDETANDPFAVPL
jgi:hypothetical protein